MPQSLVGLALETGGVLIKFTQTTVESGGAVHVQEARYPAHSPPAPLHRHPLQDERFVIMEGALKFRVGDVDRVVNAGESIEVPRATFHRAYNPGDVPTLAIWETRPALRTAEFFAAMGVASRGRTRPRLVDAAAILSEFRDEFEMAKPHPFVQRILFGCLAPFGRSVLQPQR